MSDIESELQSLVSQFVNDLSALVRQQALEAVAETLRVGTPVAHAPKKAGKPAPVAKAPVKAAGRPAKAAAAPKRKAGEKRKPEELAKLVEQLAEYIKGNPGKGVEDIAKGMNTSTKELTLPIKKLLNDKRIGSKGQKRATKYFPR
jgi:hypothetical protein